MSHRAEHDNADARRTGTAEWSESTLNVATGCPHGCLYCYARDMALRFGRIPDAAAWRLETFSPKQTAALAANVHGGRGRIMLPSAHDITPSTARSVAKMAVKLLAAPTPAGKPQTRLLLVTKADGPAVETVCRAIDPPTRHRVLWRLTIGALDDRTRKFWEPHAPDIDMRLEVLRWLARTGWQTSVSAEPLLEPTRAVALVTTVAPHVTETVWIGAARDLARRTAWIHSAPKPPCNPRTLTRAIQNLEAWQTPAGILCIAQQLRDGLSPAAWQKVRFKDSHAEPLRRFGWKIENGRPLETTTKNPAPAENDHA